MPLPTDPVTAAFTLVAIGLTTAEQVAALIAKLNDHQRTLEQAEADRRAARDRLDGKK